MVIFERKSWRPSLEMSTSSNIILPPAGSINPNKAKESDDLPAPVRPTIPI